MREFKTCPFLLDWVSGEIPRELPVYSWGGRKAMCGCNCVGIYASLLDRETVWFLFLHIPSISPAFLATSI